jgi:hypothetical protein
MSEKYANWKDQQKKSLNKLENRKPASGKKINLKVKRKI